MWASLNKPYRLSRHPLAVAAFNVVTPGRLWVMELGSTHGGELRSGSLWERVLGLPREPWAVPG